MLTNHNNKTLHNFKYVAKCALPKEMGKCEEKKARWYFTQSDNKCMPFYYTGCDGNKNSFVSLEDCEEQCPRNISE